MDSAAIKLSFCTRHLKSEKAISNRYKFFWAGIPTVTASGITSVLRRDSDYDLGAVEINENLKRILRSGLIQRFV